MLDEEYVGARQKAMLTLDEIEVLRYEVLAVIHNEDATDVKLDVVPRTPQMSNRSMHAAEMWSLFSVVHAYVTSMGRSSSTSSSSCCAASPESAPHKSAHAAHVPRW